MKWMLMLAALLAAPPEDAGPPQPVAVTSCATAKEALTSLNVELAKLDKAERLILASMTHGADAGVEMPALRVMFRENMRDISEARTKELVIRAVWTDQCADLPPILTTSTRARP